ncbi:amidohydrolase family-domain-containing protein [Apiospora marii]|uniref:Amidohydrolase family-domain-containing protein n=1 Tax=Apiospora marii TaxID=335849 RepID=A0ABR1S0V0_9PEZI
MSLAYGLSRLAVLGLCLVPMAAGAATPAPADFVFRNGSIYTLDEASSVAAALAIQGGYISSIGQDAEIEPLIGADTKVVDLEGRMLMPGLVDAHMHVLTGGLDLLNCDMNYQPVDIEQLLTHIQGCIDGDGETAGDEDWVQVVNLDYPSLVTKSGQVDKRELDTLQTKRPITIRSSDYHTNLLNSRGLALSNITAETPDPPGGKIERLPGGQEPSGVLQDAAGRELVKIPPPTESVRLEACRAALRLLRQAGITTFQEASAGPDHSALFRQLRASGELTARAYFDYSIQPPASVQDVDKLVADTVAAIKSMHDNATIGPKPTLKWQAVKMFLDGVITYPARTAAVVDPYWNPLNASDAAGAWAPDPSTLNAPYWSPEILSTALEGLFLAGVDAQLHADGDLAVRYGLDAAQAFLARHPDKKEQFRLGLAHEELSHQDDWARFAELGVDAIMSFQWAQLSSFYIPSTFATLGDYRRGNLQAHRRIEEVGRPIVYGSDWPIDPLDEFLALKVAVTRSGDPTNPNSPASFGPPYAGIFPGDPISRESALRAITVNGARFLRAEESIGSLEVGKLADLVVLEKNYFEVPAEEIGRQRVLLTMVGGEVVFAADDAQAAFGVTPKFPNLEQGDGVGQLNSRAIGGFDRRGLSRRGVAAVARLRRRGHCSHEHHG